MRGLGLSRYRMYSLFAGVYSRERREEKERRAPVLRDSASGCRGLGGDCGGGGVNVAVCVVCEKERMRAMVSVKVSVMSA